MQTVQHPPDEIHKAFAVKGDNQVLRTWADPNITVEKGDQVADHGGRAGG